MARIVLGGLILAAGLGGGPSFAGGGEAPRPPVVVAPQPGWAQLTPEERRILAPLADSWNDMEYFRRQKWLEIARRYPKLSPAEQARLQERMHEWHAMPPEDKARVRRRYEEFKKLPPERKDELKAKWEAYNQLPEEEKEKLRQKRKAELQAKTPGAPAAAAAPAASPPSPPAAPAPSGSRPMP
jgi:hypothetical protein